MSKLNNSSHSLTKKTQQIQRYKKTRHPTQAELKPLAQYAAANNKKYPDHIQLVLEKAYITVIDNYLACFPSYPEKIMLVLWDGGNDVYEAFTWNEVGKLCRVPHWAEKELRYHGLGSL